MLYWGYGSNLNEEAMAFRCPKARKIGPKSINDCRLVFRGVADVVFDKGGSCPGGLWSITDQCEEALDRFEGVAGGIYVKRYLKIRHEGGEKSCLFYQMKRERGIMPPARNYLATIAQGYRDFGLDVEYLEEAVAQSWGSKSITPTLRARRYRKADSTLARDVYSAERWVREQKIAEVRDSRSKASSYSSYGSYGSSHGPSHSSWYDGQRRLTQDEIDDMKDRRRRLKSAGRSVVRVDEFREAKSLDRGEDGKVLAPTSCWPARSQNERA